MAKTKLSKKWTTVTPLSKMLALAMLVILPFIGAYVGYKLRDKAYIKPSPVELAQTNSMMSGDSKSETVRRCGDIPREELGINYGHYTIVDGPVWAPDCRHIAWSVWQSGTSVITPPGQPEPSFAPPVRPLPIEGIYSYDDRTKRIEKIITPKSPEDTPAFAEWKDSNTIVFTRNGNMGRDKFEYDLLTKNITAE